MGQVLPFKPTNEQLQEAWEAFDAARIRVAELYAWPITSTPQERFDASMEALRQHQRFAQLGKRMEAGR